MPSCGGGRRRDERAGALARAAYWGGRGRDIDARRLPGAREGHRRAPFAGCGDALTYSPLWGCGGHRLLARNPPERGHGSGARPTRTRACGCNSDAHTHRRTIRPPDAPELLQVCTSGRSRQLRARRPLSAEAFGHGPSRARGNAVGCGRYRLQGQLRCKSTDEPVHSNIFPLRY